MNPCTRRNFLATTGAAALAAAAPATALAASRPPVKVAPFTAAQWRRVVTTDFGQDVPLGHFPGSAPGWSAFHLGSVDTAAKRGLKPGGIYDPGSTTWVSGGYLHVRQWRAASGGPVHCSTPYLLAARNVLYGRFVEVTRVSRPAVGYKSAHLLFADGEWEVDWPENNWLGVKDTTHAFFHYDKLSSVKRQLSFSSGELWTGWHTYEIRWQPGRLAAYIDGRAVAVTTQRGIVPTTRLSWKLQNESALVGSAAAPGSSAQIDTSHVEYWAWRG